MKSDETRQVIIDVINKMRPGADVPPSARIRRLHAVLEQRYLQNRTQQETASALSISVRHLRREQETAIRLLVDELQGHADTPERTSQVSDGTPMRVQLDREVQALQRASSETIASVSDTLTAVFDVIRPLARQHEVHIRADAPTGYLCAKSHPALLQQILVSFLSYIIRHMPSGSVQVSTTIVGKEIAIEVIPQPTLHLEPPDDPVLGELLQQQDMRISSSTTDDGISVLQLFVRNADRLLVLVIDDNPDLVHFYRRYVTGTRFVIETPPPDVPIVQYIAQTQPDAIILDILLPREDGWRLIQHLQGNRATQSIPIIVCSVIRETELAETLGAVDYICKPIRRNEFLAALVRATRSRSLALSEKPGRN